VVRRGGPCGDGEADADADVAHGRSAEPALEQVPEHHEQDRDRAAGGDDAAQTEHALHVHPARGGPQLVDVSGGHPGLQTAPRASPQRCTQGERGERECDRVAGPGACERCGSDRVDDGHDGEGHADDGCDEPDGGRHVVPGTVRLAAGGVEVV
jgi:hypothetical protein